MTTDPIEELWGLSADAIHGREEQLDRQERARQVELLPHDLDRTSMTARIRDYAVSLSDCTCPDFERRGLPCKHMYQLAHELGVFHLRERAALPRLLGSEADERFFSGFEWAVPRAFGPALSRCAFGRGDMLYDDRRAYDGPWSEGRQHVGYSIQVRSPERDAREPIALGEQSRDLFVKRWGHTVMLTLTNYRTGEETLVAASQGSLYSCLWKGDASLLDSHELPIPLGADDLLRCWQESSVEAMSGLARDCRARLGAKEEGNWVFLFPYDSADNYICVKFSKMENALGRHHRIGSVLISPQACQTGITDTYAPTVRAAAILIYSEDLRHVFTTLKQLLHKPVTPDEAKQRFSLSRHGWLECYDPSQAKMWGRSG